MALHARKTHSPGYIDILLVEAPKMKASLLQLIHETYRIHPWNKIYDFTTPVSDSFNMKPTLRKTITRKLKTKPMLKQIYNLLYNFFIKRKNKKLRKQLELLLKKEMMNTSAVELNLLTQTTLNQVLFDMFPSAKVKYFEHGLGDYFYIQQKISGTDKFYCIFHEPFKRMLAEKRIKNDFVFPSASPEEFSKTSEEIIFRCFQKNNIHFTCEKSPSVLILMEAVEMYNVKRTFWQEYVAKCIQQINQPDKFIFLLKPHPVQSSESIKMTKLFFEKNNLRYKLLDYPLSSGMSIEVLFPLWKENVHHVFALFSSGVFYLSMLYPYPHITYHYSYDFMAEHISNAPEQYKKHFAGLKEPIEKVFSLRCKKF
jgi:hypothetical protein